MNQSKDHNIVKISNMSILFMFYKNKENIYEE